MTTKTQINREWYIFDAKDKILGRLSTEVADLLRGKKKVDFDNAVDSGDCVVIINAEKIVLTGKKEESKRYYKHTGYIGNLKTTTVPELRESKPEQILKHAIYGMLPKNTLRDKKIKRLKIYAGTTHPHQNVKFVNSKSTN
jgi:large subunit ribosomal protein L13